MRLLFIFCHPLVESFHAAVRSEAIEGLRAAGHEVDVLDLYAEAFDPVLSAEERQVYHDHALNQRGIESYVRRLTAAEGLVIQFPTWCFGAPAMLKGFLDKLFIPGVAFDMSDLRRARPLLHNIGKLAGIVTYGQSRWAAVRMGDPPRKTVTRYIRWFIAPGATVHYYALYNMNTATAAQRRAFLARMRAAMVKF
jgi:putative NADPH-quinone reductase